MCIPIGIFRNKQKDTKNQVSSRNPSEIAISCEVEVADPKLLRLEVTGATSLGDNRFWCLADAGQKVQVKAITEPDDGSAWQELDWGTRVPNPPGNEVEIDITNAADVVVSASLDVDRAVTIEIYDLTSVACLIADTKNSKFKAYESNQVTRLKATTKPDEQRVWDRLDWTEGAPTGSKNECDVNLKPVGDRTVTVWLGAKPLAVDLHICQWPRLKIREVTFECHEVLNDGQAEIDVPFDKKWSSTRVPPAKGVKAADSQSPICFTKGQKIKLSAEFTVDPKSTDDEVVSVKGDLGFGEITADVNVGAGQDKATLPLTESTAPLPDEVDCRDAWKIDWTSLLEDDTTWVDAESSTHPLYVTLGDPKADAYFTLLDISCRAATGKSSEDDLVAKSFEPFTSHTGDNNGMERKGDGEKMSYYKQGIKTAADSDTYTTRGILSGPDATGRCGGWAALLIHMWKIHGVTSAVERLFVRALDPDLADDDLRFLVKSCDFSKTGTLPAGLYTHKAAEVTKNDGAAGQGKTNPQFDFGDHVIVKHNGKLYDPSYGLGPYTTDKDYLTAALDGLAYLTAGVVFTMSDGTEQFISDECVPYSKGFAEYEILGPLDVLAAKFKVTAQVMLDADSTLKAKRLTTDNVVAGDTLVVPFTSGPKPFVLKPSTVTMDTIAAAFGKTKQEILDHSKNSVLKAKRLTPAGVVPGDNVIISYELVADGVWVTGHDM